MRYHLKFAHIKPFVQQRTKFMLKRWKYAEDHEKWAILESWLIMVCFDQRGYYGMQKPVLVRDENAGEGYYYGGVNEIHMSKPSIITLLHEFRHAMQHQGFAGRFHDPEHDARGWSLSLYHLVAPNTLRRLVEEGKVFHTSPADFAGT